MAELNFLVVTTKASELLRPTLLLKMIFILPLLQFHFSPFLLFFGLYTELRSDPALWTNNAQV